MGGFDDCSWSSPAELGEVMWCVGQGRLVIRGGWGCFCG